MLPSGNKYFIIIIIHFQIGNYSDYNSVGTLLSMSLLTYLIIACWFVLQQQ